MGSFVAGLSGGGSGLGSAGRMLYQCFGRSSGDKVTLTSLAELAPRYPGRPICASSADTDIFPVCISFTEAMIINMQYITFLFYIVYFYTLRKYYKP